MKRLKKGAFSDSRSVFFFSFYLDMLKWPVLGDYFISETGLGATTFVPLGSLGHLSVYRKKVDTVTSCTGRPVKPSQRYP